MWSRTLKGTFTEGQVSDAEGMARSSGGSIPIFERLGLSSSSSRNVDNSSRPLPRSTRPELSLNHTNQIRATSSKSFREILAQESLPEQHVIEGAVGLRSHQRHAERHSFEPRIGESDGELEKAYQMIKRLNIAIKRYERREETKSEELLQANMQIEQLQTCVGELKQQVFSLQPLEYASDGQLIKQYQSLCASISDWADIQFGNFDHPLAQVHDLPVRGDNRCLIREYIAKDDLWDTISRYPSADIVMITYLLYKHLHETVLKEEICFVSLRQSHENFVSFVERELKHLDPPRDEEAIGMLKADIHRALCSGEYSSTSRADYLNAETQEIARNLLALLPRNHEPTFDYAELKAIMEEASQLATSIRLTPKSYRFCYAFQAADDRELRMMFPVDRERFEIIDQASGMPLKPTDVVQEAADGSIGEKLCIIFPALVREGRTESGEIELVKATILVALHGPVRRERKPKAPATTHERTEPFGDQWWRYSDHTT